MKVLVSLSDELYARMQAVIPPRQRSKVVADLERVAAKLANVTFVGKAPAEVVDQQKRRQQELLEQKEKLGRLVETLSKTHRTTGA